MGIFTAIQDDSFAPKGYYSSEDEKAPIVFDSGCSVAVTPYASDLTK